MAVDELVLVRGAHADRTDGMCALEAAAFLAGHPHSDADDSISPSLRAFLINWNDALSDPDRQQLKPLLARLCGTKRTDAEENERSWLALDWVAKTSAPTWLRLANLDSDAEALELLDMNDLNAAEAHIAQAYHNTKGRMMEWATSPDANQRRLEYVDHARQVSAAMVAETGTCGAVLVAMQLKEELPQQMTDWLRAICFGAAKVAVWQADASTASEAFRPQVESLQTSAIQLLNTLIAVGEETF